VGVRVVVNPQGYLRFRIFWNGRDIAVGTRYRDDGATGRLRRLVEAKSVLIEEKLVEGRALHVALLDVLGDCPPRLLPRKEAPRLVTLRDQYESWSKRVKPPLIRLSAWNRHRNCFESILLPRLGDVFLTEIGNHELEELRAELLAEKTQRGTQRTMKAVRNIIDWHLRACWRDAKRHGLVGDFPSLEWPRLRRPKPEPFEADERDRIIAWFERECLPFAPWIKFIFWTGTRHGEAAALRWADVDLKRGMVSISRSRDEREENEPKTAGSNRSIPLLPQAIDALKALPTPLHSTGGDYVFLSPEKKPMTDTWWPKRGATRRPRTDAERGLWHRCLTSLGIRHRKAYCTRHTFIAWACSEGANLKALAEYCGTSVAMIEQSYARYIGSDFLASLIKPAAAPEAASATQFGRPTGRSTGRSTRPKAKPPTLPAVTKWRRGELNPRPRAVRLERLRNPSP